MTEAAWSLGVAFVVFAFGAFLFARRMIGGGDVKLLAAVALWAGRDLVFDYLFITTLAGGVLAVAMIAPARLAALFPGMLRFVPAGSGGGSGAPRGSTQPSLPYGIAIAAGGIYVALTIGGQ
jgi:prepilin peptidase CpaA